MIAFLLTVTVQHVLLDCVVYLESIVPAAAASAEDWDGTSRCSDVLGFCGQWARWWRRQRYRL